MRSPNPPEPDPDLPPAVDEELVSSYRQDECEGAWEALLSQLQSRGPFHTRYRVRREIARGGMGAVLRVFDEDLRRDLAMKRVLDPTEKGHDHQAALGDSLVVGRFLEEAQVTGQLDHPSIIPVHDLGLDEQGRLFFTMKLVKGRDLRAVFENVESGADGWSRTRALTVILGACDALRYAHEKGVIHRDLKPGNIMVGRRGETYVMDWGLARILSQPDTKDLRLNDPLSQSVVRSTRHEAAEASPEAPLVTMDGDVVGTPAYMAPEQAQGQIDRMGPHSDVYSMGAILYQLCARQPPYIKPGARVSTRTILHWVQQEAPTPIDELQTDVPPELTAICEKAMAREIGDRYASMDDFADDLRAFLENRVVKAYATGAVAELRKWIRRNRAIAAAAAVGLALLLAAIITIGRLYVTAQQTAERVLELSDARSFAQVVEELDSLWPATADVADSLRRVRVRAQELRARHDMHYAAMLDLRADGTGAGPIDQVSTSFEFEDDESQWQHDAMQRLIQGLESLDRDDDHLDAPTLMGIERRIEMAASIRRVSIEDEEAAWSRAIHEISDPAISPSYASRHITPQLGLVPLGRDPESGLQEFWHVQSGTRPARDASGHIQLTEDSGMVLVLVPGGTFRMGAVVDPDAPGYDPSADPDESPARIVTVDPFFISKYEMTQGQWVHFTGQNPSYYQTGFDQHDTFTITLPAPITLLHPVEQVSWLECRTVLAKLGLELPTEAQWEYACRGGSPTRWWLGADRESVRGVINIADQAAERGGATFEYIREWPDLDDRYPAHAPVDAYPANRFGLHNVHGNVWEWCEDYYPPYTIDPRPGDGLRKMPIEGEARVFRGGSFYFNAEASRSSSRFPATSRFPFQFTGVRAIRRLDG